MKDLEQSNRVLQRHFETQMIDHTMPTQVGFARVFPLSASYFFAIVNF